MDGIEFDFKEFDKSLNVLEQQMDRKKPQAADTVANEILRLSQREVPIHTVPGEPGGALQNSGFVESWPDESIVGYNIEYAAYQHEGQRADGSHVVRHYTNARSKRKYLEDPIKNNIPLWNALAVKVLGVIFK